jgi:CheY-like chemotaxis protein
LRICLAEDFPRSLAGVDLAGLEEEETAQRKPGILVVDDERVLADTTAAVLRGAGYDAKTAYDGYDALEIIKTFHPDLVLTDIMMPAMNGLELAITIRKTYPRTRVVLFSGQAGIADMLEDSRTRGYEFPLLAKPVHPSQLIEKLRSLRNN